MGFYKNGARVKLTKHCPYLKDERFPEEDGYAIGDPGMIVSHATNGTGYYTVDMDKPIEGKSDWCMLGTEFEVVE